MATLLISGATQLVRTQHWIGRSRAMHTRIRSGDVSAQHASIQWTEQGWVLRDMGSRNGTHIGDRTLLPGQALVLTEGMVVRFGSETHNTIQLTSAAPPVAAGISASDLVMGSSEFLALPSEDEPVAVVTFRGAAGWTLSTADGAERQVDDGSRIEVGGTSWELVLPELLAPTREASASVAAPMALRFAVSADEEYVELSAVVSGQVHRLPPRAHHYVLLVLARARLNDQSDGVRSSEQGWVYTSELARMLNASANQLYVSLHRARKELGALHPDPDHLPIERRRTTQQLRLGTNALTVAAL